MGNFKIKRDGDLIYEIFLLERGKRVNDGVKYLYSFDDFEEKDGFMIFNREGKYTNSSIDVDYDLMLVSISKVDLSSIKQEKTFNSFTVYQIESINLTHKYDEPTLISLKDTLKVKVSNSWSNYTIKDGPGLDALINRIRREISLGKIGI